MTTTNNIIKLSYIYIFKSEKNNYKFLKYLNEDKQNFES